MIIKRNEYILGRIEIKKEVAYESKSFFKKIAAFALAGTMVLGSAMVTLADVENADVETYTATDDSVNSQEYKPGKVYCGDENVFNAKERHFRDMSGIQ